MNATGLYSIELFISLNSNNNNDLDDTGKILAIAQTSSDAQLTASCYLETTDYINVGFCVDTVANSSTCTLGSRCNLSISLIQRTA
jgi:hypothetical protein